ITSWTNPAPEMEIQTLEYVSSMAQPAPFLLAITAVPAAEGVAPLGGSAASTQTQATTIPLTYRTLVVLLSSVLVFLVLIVWLRTRRRRAAMAATTMLPLSVGDSSLSLVYLPSMTPALSESSSVSIPSGELGQQALTPADDDMWRRRALE